MASARVAHFERPMFHIQLTSCRVARRPSVGSALGPTRRRFRGAGREARRRLVRLRHVGQLSLDVSGCRGGRLGCRGSRRASGRCRSCGSPASPQRAVDGEFLCVKEDGICARSTSTSAGALAVDIALSRAAGCWGMTSFALRQPAFNHASDAARCSGVTTWATSAGCSHRACRSLRRRQTPFSPMRWRLHALMAPVSSIDDQQRPTATAAKSSDNRTDRACR